VDANFKETTDSDPAALWVIDTVGAGRYVRQRVTAHGFPDTLRAIQELVAAWSPDGVVIENKANGAAIISTLRQKVSGVVEWEPGQDSKPARAANMQPSVEAGDWLLPDGADWVDEVVGQFATFPRGAHDDDVDAGSQAHAYLNQPPFFFIG
jgi:predicted phage terminase large subunit-like protein